MRRFLASIVPTLCMVVAACSGQLPDSPTSPTSATSATAQTAATGGTNLPFNGSLTMTEVGVIAPPNLVSEGTAQGTGTHLGRYTASFNVTVDLATGTATGTYTFTAANGDQLFTTFDGIGVPIQPGVASITETTTVVSGTGRFAAATGTFTIRRILDQATGKSEGSFEGTISLNKGT
jgi:hypothetical protein